MSYVAKVYCAYVDLETKTTEIFHDGEITTINGFRVCDVINMSTNTICFVPSVKIMMKVYPGGEWDGSEYYKNNDSDILSYKYGKCEFRSFGALICMQNPKTLNKMYTDLPICVAMYQYLCDIGEPEKIKYPLAHYAKKKFYEGISEELWNERKKIGKYYWDEETYWDMMASVKGGVLSDYRSKYVEDVLLYDIRSAYASVLVNDDKFPVGKIIKINCSNKEYCLFKVQQFLKKGVWFKIVFDGKHPEFARWYDKKADKTGIEYYNYLTIQTINKHEMLFDYLRTVDFRLYYSKETGYVNKLVRDKIVDLYNQKETQEHGTFERYITKTQIEMIYGKGIQHYDFEDLFDIQDHYRGRGDNYLTPEMSNHCLAKIEHEIYMATANTTSEYFDTDGIKVRNEQKAIDYFNNENERIMESNRKAGYDTDIGTWKFEGNAQRMLIFTPKIYIYEVDGEIEFKAAGVDKEYKEKFLNKIKGDKIMYLRKHGFKTATKKYVYNGGDFEIRYAMGELKGDL